MITLDQVQKLEKKVNDAVDLINRLKTEKVVLEEKVENYELRILELEEFAEQLNKDQTEIEDKIIGALSQLEDLDNDETTVQSTEVELDNESADIEEETIQEEETSVNSSVSDDVDIVETDDDESDDSVENSEILDENSSEDELESDAILSESKEDNQFELQESITEDSQVGISEEETVEEEEVPTVDSEFGEMPEDTPVEDDKKSGTDLFEQSLDIF